MPTEAHTQPVLGKNITRQRAAKFLSLVSYAMKTSVIRLGPQGPWHVSANRELQDCISVPDPSGTGELHIGKFIDKRALRVIIAADPTNLEEIANLMSTVTEVDTPTPVIQHLLTLAATWNRSMDLQIEENWTEELPAEDEPAQQAPAADPVTAPAAAAKHAAPGEAKSAVGEAAAEGVEADVDTTAVRRPGADAAAESVISAAGDDDTAGEAGGDPFGWGASEAASEPVARPAEAAESVRRPREETEPVQRPVEATSTHADDTAGW